MSAASTMNRAAGAVSPKGAAGGADFTHMSPNTKGNAALNVTLSPVLSEIESQRIIAILKDVVEKLTFLGSITPDVMQHRDELSKFVGSEITRTLQEQRRLEARYQELIGQRAELKGIVNKTKYKELQSEVQVVSQQLRSSTNQLCRSLKENPNISGNLMKIERERTELTEILERTIRELGTTRTFHILLAKVEEDRLTQARLTEVITQEKETSTAVAKIESELQSEMDTRKQTVAEQQAIISRLKQDLQAVKSKIAIEIKYARREAKAKTNSTQRIHAQEEKDLETKLRELRSQQETAQQVHDRLLSYLRDKQKELNDKVDACNKNAARDLAELDSEYQQVRCARERTLERLERLRSRRQLELEEERNQQEADNARLEKEQKAVMLMRKQRGAVAKIERLMMQLIAMKKAEEEARLATKKAKPKETSKGKKGKK